MERNAVKLSILTPAVWSRAELARALAEKIAGQTTADEVEHLVLFDNKRRSVGAKRQALIDMARGEYVAFVDDDDDISDDYVDAMLSLAATGADVLCFDQEAMVNGQTSRVKFSCHHQDGPFVPGGETLRSAWHVCGWKRKLVASCQFEESNYGEDLTWCVQARQMVKTEARIPRVLHFYRHNATTTEAPPP
jgi:glycosyltransferase involved in cell wall biosynthesis